MHRMDYPGRLTALTAAPARRRQMLTLAAALVALSSAPSGAAPPQNPPQGSGRGIQAVQDYPVLPIGSPLPDFALPGVDGKIHRASQYAGSPVLAIVFESNHCPTSQLYEERIERLYAEYRKRGVRIVAVNPNNPKTVRLDELGYTDVTDSLEEMTIRSKFRGIDWPYLYDGETQAVSMTFGAVATPHIFIFDRERKLRYQGRIDDNQREALVKTHDARNAIEALLAGRPVPVAETKAFGCTTKWLSKASGVEQEWARIQAEPVNIDMVGADDLKRLRTNPTDKVMLAYFWSTGCAECAKGFLDVETTYRMYRRRAFELVTISTDPPANAPAVLAFLKKEYASSPNRQFGSPDRAALQASWGEKWNPDTPLTMVIAPGGEVLYRRAGPIDILEVRRVILAAMPDTSGYIGSKAYWTKAVERMRKR